ncbi:MAG: hypothetical protein D3910_23325 [Candidatus Electrothrix sp. ATG2]|nr:hypothetical protein [Candidatus Electrothrix sp. ATG2]
MNMVSPHYTAKKLEPPFYRDLVDVFEDRIRYWMLKPAQKLLEDRNDQVAAVGILINYIEGIQIYLSGEDSKDRSFNFFRQGLNRIIKPNHEMSDRGVANAEKFVAKAIYKYIRCGFSHDGMCSYNIFFDNKCNHIFMLTWKKENGQLMYKKDVESIIINPEKFYKAIEAHFNLYIRELKKNNDKKMSDNFRKAVGLKWNLSKDSIVIGVSSEKDYIDNYRS